MSGRLLGAALAAAFATGLAGAPAALAAPTVSITMGNHLSVTGDGSAETYVITTVQDPGGSVSVTGPAPMAPPAGGTGNMAPTLVPCPSSTAAFVDLDAAGGGDTITVSDGRLFSVTAKGGAGNDTLNAGSTPLAAGETGGPDDDTFNGMDSRADFFVAESGNDTHHGGTATPPDGADPATYQVNFVEDVYALSGSTAATISLDGSANDSDGQGGTDNVGTDAEGVVGTAGNDTLSAGPNATSRQAGDGDDTLTGSAEADLLSGGAGNDRITGNAGDDSLADGDRQGGVHSPGATSPPAGNDSLDGGPGNDTITEWFGADDVIGGPGEDTVDPARLVEESRDLRMYPPPHSHSQPLTISLDDQANDGATGQSEGDNIHADVENV